VKSVAGHREYALAARRDEDQPFDHPDVQPGAGLPAERMDDGIIGDSATIIYRGQP
jgi:hypothetical protein